MIGCGESDDVIQDHGDITSQRLLDFDGIFRCQFNDTAIQVASKGCRVFGDLVDVTQAEDLKATAICQDRAFPSTHGVKSAQTTHGFVTGTQGEVVGIAQNHVGSGGHHLIDSDTLDRPLGANGHESRRLNLTSRCQKNTATCLGGFVAVQDLILE